MIKLIKRYYWILMQTHSYFNKRKKEKDFYDWMRRYVPLLKRFENLHAGKDCFIIGNGPSLNKMDLTLLNQYYTFGLNKIHLLFEKVPLNLSYHVAVNPLVVEQMEKVLKNNIFECPSFLSYDSSNGLFNDNKNVIKLMTERSPWSFYTDLTGSISEGYTVTYIAMQIAYYMGFKRVFLIGVDHNFNQTGKPNEEQLFTKDDDNHFHPDYFKGLKWHLADIEGNEASYGLAKHWFHKDKREIFDATIDGKLTIFSKITFEEALSIATPKI